MPSGADNAEFRTRAAELIGAGRSLCARDMLPATSGNLSARLGDSTFAITVPGSHKGMPHETDIMQLDAAHQAGMRTVWLVHNSEPEPGAAHPQASNFNAIRP